MGAPYVVGTAETTRIRLDWLGGDWTGLEERAERLVQTYAHLLPLTCEVHLVRGWLATAHGDWDLAETCFHATGMARPDSAIIPVAIAAIGGMVTMPLSRGDVDAACTYADRGAILLRAKRIWAWAGELAPRPSRRTWRAGASRTPAP
ncbi:hypothetical protein E1287_05315 [Actinomadura sp. KC06]|nr:hypothetical protein E1287_05315 [Actinomadura sp. KC06]